jgi:hypothetical protein
MSDEKWWGGLVVARTFAKLCPELGIDEASFIVHHKEHITNVMEHATVGYLFTDDPELLLHLYQLEPPGGIIHW